MQQYKDWYWIVGGSTTQVYSSLRNAYVPITDAAYVSWLGINKGAPNILSENDIWYYVNDVVQPWLYNGTTFAQPSATTYTKDQLKAYAAQERFNKETGGIMVSGMPVVTDRESQGLINGAYSMATHDSTFTTKWKAGPGTFITLDAPTIIAVATAVGAHVAACFSAEATVNASINAGTTTTLAQIDAVISAVSV
jgi:hypothetical protein